MITPTTLLIILVTGSVGYLLYKKLRTYWVNSEVDEIVQHVHDVHAKAEKAKNVNAEQYQHDKEIVDQIKNLH